VSQLVYILVLRSPILASIPSSLIRRCGDLDLLHRESFRLWHPRPAAIDWESEAPSRLEPFVQTSFIMDAMAEEAEKEGTKLDQISDSIDLLFTWVTDIGIAQ